MKSSPLPLADGAAPCLRCGHCCKVRSCPFGVWDTEKDQCCHLVPLFDDRYSCAIYDQILALPENEWFCAPAFGAGCCSSLNSDRQRLARKGTP